MDIQKIIGKKLDEFKTQVANNIVNNVGKTVQNTVIKPTQQAIQNWGQANPQATSNILNAPRQISNIVQPALKQFNPINIPQTKIGFNTQGFNPSVINPTISKVGQTLQKIQAPIPQKKGNDLQTKIYNLQQQASHPFEQVANFINPLPIAGQLIDKTAQGKLFSGGIEAKLGDVVGVASILPQERVLGKAAGYFKSVAKPEDVNLIKNFAAWVEQTGGKGNPAKYGIDLPAVHAMARDIFGDKVSTLSNQKLKNIYDALLQEVGKGKNNLNLGLTTDEVKRGVTAIVKNQKMSPKASLLKTLPQEVSQIGKTSRQELTSSLGNSLAQNKPIINTNNLNISKKAKNLVNSVAEDIKPQIEKVTGKKLSNKQVIDTANTSAKVLRSVIPQEQTLAWESSLLKARQKLADLSQKGTVDQEYLDTLMSIKTNGTDIARKLQSFSIGADPQSVTAKQAILEEVMKVAKNSDEILKAAKGVNFNDLNQATNFYRKFVKPNLTEWNDLIRYNSMLSSPNTHINNMASNAQGTGLIAPIEKTVLGGVDFLKSSITGQPRQYMAGEGIKYAQGYYSSVGKAAHAFADVLRGKSMSGNPDLRNIPLTTGGIPRAAENVLSFPLKMLEASDQFFQTLTKGGVEKSLTYRASKGVKVLNPQIKASEEAAYRLFRGDTGNKTQGEVLNGLDLVTNTIMKVRNSNNKVASTIAKFTLPFVKTPMNLFKQGIEYSPVGFSTMWGAKNKEEQFTKALMGTAIGVGSAMLLGSDRLTWAEPVSQKQKNAFRAAGMQPYSVKIGDNWVSYSKLHPLISFNLAIVAAVKNAMDKKTIGDTQAETILSGLANVWQFYADQSFVKNIGDFVASAQGSTNGIAQIASNYALQEVPFRAMMGWVTRLVDKFQRVPDENADIVTKQMQYFLAQIPGLSQTLPTRNDAQGNPIENPNRVLNAFSPARVTTENSEKKKIFDGIMQKSLETRNKNDLVLQAKSQAKGGQVGNIIVANDGSTIDLTPPTKGTGIDAFSNENWRYTKAREIWKNRDKIPQDQLQQALKKLGADQQDTEYDYKATHTNDVKTQYIMSKATTMPHDTLLGELVKGRVVSVTGTQFASNGVIDNLYNEGVISKAEQVALKKIKVDKTGKSLTKAGSGGKKLTIPKISARTVGKIKTTKSRKVRLKKIATKSAVTKLRAQPKFAKIDLTKSKKFSL